MAINRYIKTALKTISNIDIDVKKDYELIRRLERVVKRPPVRFINQMADYEIKTDDHNIPIRIYSPALNIVESLENVKKYPVIVFFHGGGWTTGDLDSYERLCLRLARQTGHIVVSVGYRLAPENPFPAALRDCHRAIRSVARWHRVSGSDNKITIMGDSAGGNLAAAVSLYMRDRGEVCADRQILIYPALYNDHTSASPFASVAENGAEYVLTAKNICDYMDLYCPVEEDRQSPYCAPLLADDLSGQPDTLIITAQYDPLRDEGEEYGRRLRAAGNNAGVYRIDDTLHGFFSLPASFGAVKKSFEIINQFLKEDPQ